MAHAITLTDLRGFLMQAFSDTELESFCFDHYPSVKDNFGDQMSKAQEVQLLLEHCRATNAFSGLLEQVKAERSERFRQTFGTQDVVFVDGPDLGAGNANLTLWVVGAAALVVVVLALVLVPRMGAAPAVAPTPMTSQSTITISAPATPTPVPPTPTLTPTPAISPRFTLLTTLPIGDFEVAELQANTLITGSAAETLVELRSVDYVQLDGQRYAYRVQLFIHNPLTQPLRLALQPEYFVLEDSLGREANQLFFCCSRPVDVIAAGQERQVQLFFEDNQRWGSGGKGGVSALYLRLRGLLPIISARWLVHLLVTAN